MGSTRRCNDPSQKDSDVRRLTSMTISYSDRGLGGLQLVSFIREAGGIPFVKTNVPQTLLAFECANPLWGISKNPYSANHTPGGSSGGEAAILAMDGAALGWGSDIGGSLRIPAHYCGVYSLKPGHGRIATSNNSSTRFCITSAELSC
jgi:Asp-tRNA(Asn)/Glu-tRNA(Gln) amidotransferase A subunit family amidase